MLESRPGRTCPYLRPQGAQAILGDDNSLFLMRLWLDRALGFGKKLEDPKVGM